MGLADGCIVHDTRLRRSDGQTYDIPGRVEAIA